MYKTTKPSLKLTSYKKTLGYSYTLGAYPTLDLINYRPDLLTKVFLKTGASGEGIEQIVKHCKAHDIPYEHADKAINRVADKENTYVVGVFHKFRNNLNSKNPHTVLVNPSNLGNLGTIIRTSIAMGYKDLAIIDPAIDIFHPKSVRAAMGSLFQMNIEYFSDIKQYTTKFPKHKLYTFMTDGEASLRDFKFDYQHSLVFGNEGAGLSDDYKKMGQSVRIPHSTDIDSLNLATAVGIAQWEAGRKV